jgi:hypothetical protein
MDVKAADKPAAAMASHAALSVAPWEELTKAAGEEVASGKAARTAIAAPCSLSVTANISRRTAAGIGAVAPSVNVEGGAKKCRVMKETQRATGSRSYCIV